MRIALLHPTYWPEVRRGSERLVHDLGAALVQRGHAVTLLTSHPAAREVSEEDGMRVVRARRPPEGRLRRVADEMYLTNAPAAAIGLLRGSFDVAHAFYPVDARAAVAARRLGGPPVVFSFHGMPSRAYLDSWRPRRRMLRATMRRATATTVLSEAARERFGSLGLGSPRIVPGGAFVDAFARRVERASEPTLVCASNLSDPRKGGDLLFAAFSRLRERVPGARLLLAGGRDPAQRRVAPDTPAGAEWVRADDTAALADLYAGSWASVLAGVDEAFGLVLVESLAAGTPVAASRSGACPELISVPEAGRLFAPSDTDGAARAMEEALELGSRPGIAEACASHARRWDWSRVAPLHEGLYAEACR